MEKLELQIWYIADAIIDVKLEKFGERFVSIKELLIIKEIIELRLKEKKLSVRFIDKLYNMNYFTVDNDVITKTEGKTLKMYISNEEIRKLIYDEELIYYCLCKILISKLYNSMEHTCDNCHFSCDDFLKDSDRKACCGWEHNFAYDWFWILSKEEQRLIDELQSEEISIKKLTKNIGKEISDLNNKY